MKGDAVKIIPTRVHGSIDYVVGAMMLILPRLLKWPATVITVLTLNGAGALLYSLFTRYELGVVRMLPMRSHLILDALGGVALLGTAGLLPNIGNAMRGVLAGFGLFELVAATITKWETSLKEETHV
jgi:hypothetical protein